MPAVREGVPGGIDRGMQRVWLRTRRLQIRILPRVLEIAELHIGANHTPSGLVVLRGGGRIAFLAMSQTYRGEGFGRADNHYLSVSVDAQRMDVPGGISSTDCP